MNTTNAFKAVHFYRHISSLYFSTGRKKNTITNSCNCVRGNPDGGSIFVSEFIQSNLNVYKKMKKLILVLAIIGLAAGSYAQNLLPADVPQAVVKSFTKKNPKVEQVEWSKSGDFYKATFADENTGKSVYYDAAGKVKQSEMQVSISQLPTPVLKYVNDNHPSEVVKHSSKITNAKGKSTYVVKVKDSELFFDSNGKYMEPVIQ
jgi:hypothetical protein